MRITSMMPAFFHRHIGATLVMWFIILAVIPVIVMLTFALNQADRQTYQQAVDQLDSVATIKFNEVERWLGDQGTILNLLLVNNDPQIQAVLNQRESQTEGVNAHFQAYLKEQDTFTEFFLYDTDGHVVASTAPMQQGKIVFDQPYFKPSLNGNYIQAPFYEASTSELNMILSHPVKNAAGKVMGVLAGRLKMTELSQIMTERAGLGNTGETYLVSLESNYLVTASRFEGYPLTHAYHSQGIDSALAGQNGSGAYLDYRGVPNIGVYLWLPEMQSGLLAEIDESEAFTTLNQIRAVSLATAAVIGLISAGIGILISLRITRPIVALTSVANQVATGNYSLRAMVIRSDEIGQLGSAFNTMTERLGTSIEVLSQTNQQLTIAMDQAQEAVRAKDAFLAVMSHELRTPLNAIMGFTTVIQKRGSQDERAVHMLDRITANCNRLLALVSNILDISQIAAGKLQLREETVDLPELITELCGQMEILAQKKELEFTFEIDSNLHDIVSSREALTKVVTNLLSNAIKFTDKGEVALRACRQNEKLKIEVRDTGIGIPTGMHETIFETFRQVDNASIKRAYGGSGLGLAIVKELCTALGGLINVSSVLGQGSTFTIIMPLKMHSNMEVSQL